MPRARRERRRLLAAAFVIAALAAAAGDARAEVPFLAPGRLVVVTAAIEGRPARLLVDTGDPGRLLLYDDAAARLGLRPGAPIAGTRRGLFGSAPGLRRPLHVDHLAVDGAAWSAVEGAVIPAEPDLARAVGAGFDGILGAALLEGRRLVLDYRARTLQIDAPGATAPRAGPAASAPAGAPLRIVDGRIVTTVLLSIGPRAALVDTAAATSLVDGTALGRTPAGAAAGAIDAEGRAAGLPTARLGRITAGGRRFGDAGALVVDLATWFSPPASGDAQPIALVLGADLLAEGRATLDLGAGRFTLEPAP